MEAESGCDGVMIGRAARGNPWIFGETGAGLAGRPAPAQPTAAERIAVAARHLSLVIEDKGPKLGVLQMRKHIAWYMRGTADARALRERVNRSKTEAELLAVLDAATDAAAVTGTFAGQR
jgi:tRNA-dihydrouridine synthase